MNLDIIQSMKHSPVRNYIVPGLTSWLIGEPSPKGTVRLFEMERDQHEFITPHSHRFDFECYVMAGFVENEIWVLAAGGDLYQATMLHPCGDALEMGKYTRGPSDGPVRYATYRNTFREGQTYRMTADEIHAIRFGKGARVLFFEGPQVQDSSLILEPVVDGKVIPTFKTQPWMFKRDLLVPAKPNRPMKGPDVCSRSPQ